MCFVLYSLLLMTLLLIVNLFNYQLRKMYSICSPTLSTKPISSPLRQNIYRCTSQRRTFPFVHLSFKVCIRNSNTWAIYQNIFTEIFANNQHQSLTGWCRCGLATIQITASWILIDSMYPDTQWVNLLVVCQRITPLMYHINMW